MIDKKEYMSDPKAKTIDGFIEGLQILSVFVKNKKLSDKIEKFLKNESFTLSAEHDIIYIHVDSDVLPLETPIGLKLSSLGFHINIDNECWAYFT